MKNLTLKVKNTLLVCLFVLMTLCLTATSLLGFSSLADTNSIVKMRGASVRISSQVEGEYGLRFGTLIEKETYDSIEKAADFKVGMLYIPTDLVDGELTASTPTVGNMTLTDNAVEENVDGVDYYSYRGYIRNMPASEYDREISARSYIYNNGQYTYADEISRSTLYVARAEYEEVPDNQDVIDTLYFDPYVAAKITHEGGSTTLNDDNTLQVSVPHYSGTGIHVAKTLDTYKAGTYIMTEFVGVNMIPTIFFGVTETGTLRGLTTSNDYHNIGLTGVGIYAGVAAGSTRYVYRATSTETATSVGYKNYYNYGYLVTKNTGHYGDAATTACDKTYVLVMGADNVTGGVNVEHMLFEKNTTTGELTLVESVTKLVEDATLNRGSIVFGSATNLGINANFKLYTPNTRDAIVEKLGEVYGYYIPTIASSDFVTSTGASVSVSDNGTTNTALDDYYTISTPFSSATNHNYAYTAKSYAPGTYVLIEFLGANFPQKIIFGSDEVTTGAIGSQDTKLFAASGVGFNGDEGGYSYTWYKETASNTVSASQIGLEAIFCRTYFVTNNPSKTFVMLAGANNVDGTAVVEYSLFEKDATTGALTIVTTISQAISGATVEEGRIVFASSVKAQVSANFKLYTPDTKENLIDLMADVYGYNVISSANVEFSNSTHTITDVEKGKVNITLNYSGTYEYAKTITKYAPGDYVLLEFAGENAPMNLFFGATSVDDLSTDANDPHIVGIGLRGDRNAGTSAIIKKADGTIVTGVSTTSDRGVFDRRYLFGTDGSDSEDYFADAVDTDEWRARKYVMLAGVIQDGVNAKIEYTIWLNDNGTLTEIQTKEFVFENQTIEEGSIVFTPSIKRQYHVSLNMYTPDTKANLLAKIDSVYGTYLSEGEE